MLFLNFCREFIKKFSSVYTVMHALILKVVLSDIVKDY